MTNFIIGIDGGQSSTQCALATTAGELLGFGVGGGLIHFAAQDSHTVYIKALHEATQSAWAAAGLDPQPLAAIALGLTGVEASTPDKVDVPEIKTQRAERTRIRKTHHAVRARTRYPKLVRRSHGNPMDAQARDTRIQVWPCKSGGICNWRRSR